MQDLFPLLAPLALVLTFLWLALQRGISFPPARYAIPALIIIAYVAWLGSFQNLGLLENPLRFVARDAQIIYMLIFFLLMASIPADPRLDQKVIRIAIAVGCLVGLFTMMSYVTGPISLFGKTVGHIDDHTGRKLAVGLLEKNSYAASMGQLVVVLVASRFVTSDQFHPLRPNKTWFLVLAFLAIALLLSRSRGYSVGTMATIFMMWMFARGDLGMWSKTIRFSLIGLVAVTAVAIEILGGGIAERLATDVNVLRRLALFERSFEYIGQSPLIGIGPGSFKHYDLVVQDVLPGLVAQSVYGVRPEEVFLVGNVAYGQHTHNWALQFLVDFGIFGTVMYFGFVFYTMRGPQMPEANIGMRSDTRSVTLWNHLQSLRLMGYYLLFFYAIGGISAGYIFVSPTGAWMFFFFLGRAAATRSALDYRFIELGAVPKFRRLPLKQSPVQQMPAQQAPRSRPGEVGSPR